MRLRIIFLTTMTDPDLEARLSALPEPVLGGTLSDHGIVSLSAGDADATLTFPYPSASVFKDIKAHVDATFSPAPRLAHQTRISSHTVQGGVERVPGVRNVIAVSSAKGGVGKSTTAASLAVSLAREGASAGLLDADIYGPSVPLIMGVSKRPETAEGDTLLPIKAHGVSLMSIGFMIEDEAPVVWRGPLVNRALLQLLRETRWPDIDYLVVDMPPGTGDIQLTLAQQMPVTGAIIVTTPQEIALADARRGIEMFAKVNIPVIGIVENMAMHTCPNCGHESHIFGSGGAQALCEARSLELLGSLPLDMAIRRHVDEGVPTAAAEPDGPLAAAYQDIAIRAAARIALKSKDRSAAFPKIVVSNT